MAKQKNFLSDGLFMVAVLSITFLVNLVLETYFQTQTLIPMIFVLGVFIISWKSQGYFWGITASLISVLAVNYAFTYPYYAFDLIRPECLFSAAVMLIVAIMTGAMTTQIKMQEKMKAEADKERVRSNLLRAVSHDLRTPLTAIYGSCTALIDNYEDFSPEQRHKLLTDMRTDAQWLVRMVENLLSVTRIDGEYVRLSKRDTVLEELVDDVLVNFRKRFPGQTVQVQIPDDFVSIPMDAMLIEQVLLNLLENAVLHAVGMKNLRLQVDVTEKQATFRILDDGCGIPVEKLAHLFSGIPDQHTSADKGRSNMGIGLSVCATIISAHGGSISASNRPGGGTEFRFTLEIEEQNNEQQQI